MVTDKGIRGLGLTTHLKQLLAEHQIACAMYDNTQANPTTIKEIRKEDIPEMALHADKEANPIYPMAELWDAKELEKLYYLVYEENGNEQ
jgi:hypothetical protein